MRYAMALSLLCALPCLSQAPSTKGACSPIVLPGARVEGFTLHCDGMSMAQGQQLLDILNRMAKNQLDPKVVMAKFDEITKALAAQKSLSPDDIGKGVKIGIEDAIREQQKTMQDQMNDPKAQQARAYQYAKGAYQWVSDFLDRQQRQNQQLAGLGRPANLSDEQIIASYQGRYADNIYSTLHTLQTRGYPVKDILELSKNVTSVDDIRRIADGLKKVDQPITRLYNHQLTTLLNPQSRVAGIAPVLDTNTLTINGYLGAGKRLVSNYLEKVQAEHIRVDELLEMNANVKSVADIERLSDGLKKLSESLAPR